MATVKKAFLELGDGRQVPVKIYTESRGNVRASIGKKAIILRMPLFMLPHDKEKQMQWFRDWVIQQFEKNKGLEERFFGKGYKDGDTLQVGERSYILKFDLQDKKSHNARLHNGIIHLELSKHDNEAHTQKAIKHLLSRVIAKDYKSDIVRRVNEINNLYFRKEIKSVNLKLNQTNWGSCSSKGNVNLSTRLLFAPEEVIDYVIIHELAHLIEMNHSSRFWKLVEDAMPNYKESELWLKKNDHLCNF